MWALVLARVAAGTVKAQQAGAVRRTEKVTVVAAVAALQVQEQVAELSQLE